MLLPRFLPDRNAPQEWGTHGKNLAALIKTGLRIPPIAAFGLTQVREALTQGLPEEPPEYFEKACQTLRGLLLFDQEWPLRFRGETQESRIEKPLTSEIWKGLRDVVIREPSPSAVLIQPVIEAESSGRTDFRLQGIAPDSPFLNELKLAIQHATRVCAGPSEVEWAWDGEQLWILGALPAKHLIRPRHLLVDLDGTLLGAQNLSLSLRFTARIIGRFMEKGSWHQAFRGLWRIQKTLGLPAATLDPTHSNSLRVSRAFAREFAMDESEAIAFLDLVLQEEFPKVARYFYPIPGAAEFIEWAKGHFPMTLATNPVFPEAQVLLRLQWARIDSRSFARKTHSSLMHSCKPAPQYFRQVMSFEPTLEPHDFLMIGDDKSMDWPATELGIPTFLLKSSGDLEWIPNRNGTPAWRGTYEQLRRLLADANEIR